MSAPTSRRAIICGTGLSLAAVAASAMASTPVATIGGISPKLAALLAEADARDGLAGQHQRLVVDSAVGQAALAAAVAENNALNFAYVDALDAVAFHPVSTVADLQAKLAFMLRHQMGDGCDWLDEINADVVRIAAAGGR